MSLEGHRLFSCRRVPDLRTANEKRGDSFSIADVERLLLASLAGSPRRTLHVRSYEPVMKRSPDLLKAQFVSGRMCARSTLKR